MIDRIKLAEAMFPEWTISSNIHGDSIMWHGKDREGKTTRATPDPFTDANDCDLLKQWLCDRGWHIEIKRQAHTSLCPAPAVYVEIWHEISEIHHRFDSDGGESYTVARAALKVLS